MAGVNSTRIANRHARQATKAPTVCRARFGSGHPISLCLLRRLWRPTERGDAYAFATTEPNAIVAPWHPKAMPVILQRGDLTTWLDSSIEAALALVKPFEGTMRYQIETPDAEVE